MTDLPPLQDAAFRLIIEDAPDGILLVDQAGRIIFANRQVRELFGYEPRELIGQRVEVLMPSRKRAMHVIHREIYQERPETRPMGTGLDLAGQRKDGTEFPVEISLSRLSTVGGSFSVAAVRDVSRQRRAEEALRRSEERHRLLAEQARDVIFRYRLLPTPGFEYVSAAMQRLLGYPPEEFYVDDGLIFRVVHSEDREILERALTADGPRSFELRLRDRKGEVRWFEQGISPVVDSQGVIVALEGIARDVTERRTAEEDRSQLLLEVERQLERERIAGDLHDDTIQSIYALGLAMHAALADETVTKEAALERAIEGLNSVIGELRTYMQDLSGFASGAEPVGLGVRVRGLVPEQGDTAWSVRIDETVDLDPALERHVYLLAKELISNVYRHAEARHASVTLTRAAGDDGECAVLKVADDGCGFDRDSIGAGSYGMRSIEQRVAMLGGSLDIASARGSGTTVTIAVPFAAQRAPATRRPASA